jgi:hypothetical protein
MTNPVEGYNMLIFEKEDGSVTYTGSFNRAEWDAYLEKRGSKAKVDEGTVVPDPPPAEPAPEGPAADERSEQPATEQSIARGRHRGGKKDEG